MKIFTYFTYLSCLILFISACRNKKDVNPRIDVTLPKDMMIVDAEYNKKRDILVYVSTHPNQLTVFLTATNKIVNIPLDFVPISVSIALDGNNAVVGFDAHLSHVDLKSNKVVKTYDVSCEALDIVLGSNNWAYVFPKRDQWETIRCVDLANGKETKHVGNFINAGTKGKLHPSGKYIYAANNFISPTDIEKFDIQAGTAVRMYDSPYHGTYPMDGDLWISEEGNRVFMRGQTTLRLSEEKSQDMIYGGTVGLDTTNQTYGQYKRIMSLAHAPSSNQLYLISSDTLYKNRPNLPYIWIYNGTNLTYQRKITLTDAKPGVFTPTSYLEPQFVFAHSNGKQIYVITKAVEGTVTKWAIKVL